MNKIGLVLAFLFVIQNLFGQIETKYFPEGNAIDEIKAKEFNKATKLKKLPPFQIQELIDEDLLKKGLDVPFRFGKGFDTHISFDDGDWTQTEEGRLWSIMIQSEGAYSINFVFDHLYLPYGSELYISNLKGTMLYGPVTSKHNPRGDAFLTDIIQGDVVSIYLIEPSSVKGKSELSISRVVHGYKNLFSEMSYGNPGSSEECNNDIACFPAWDDESDAVAMVLLSEGTELCSGSLLMTANQSFNPYFLTAFHCVDSNQDDSLSVGEINNAENWLFKFQYKMTSCDGNTPTVGITYVGSDLLSAWHKTDFALMEMEESPLVDYRFSWLGWDRTSNTPSSGKSIHHPSGDAMKISFENSQFQTSSWDGTNNHWLVYFNDGVVEHASSGSPILDQNDRVVGQLHGNQYYNPYLNYCSQPRAEYGRFNLSWDGGGTDDTRLSNWLDPFNSGMTTTNTARAPYISGSTLVCASGSAFTVNNLPSGSTIVWDSDSLLSRVSSQGSNPCTFSSSGFGSTWISATINFGGGGTITLPHFNVWSGIPALTSLSGPSPFYDEYGCTGQPYSFWTNPARDALSQSSYEWAVEPSYFSWYFQSQYNDWATVVFNDPNEYYQVRVRATNTCGASNWVSKMVSITDCYRFLLYPNPASGEVTISLTVAESVKKEEVPSNVLVRVTDNSGITYYSGTKGGDSFTIPVSNLKDGNYIVSIIYDGKIENLPLIIKN